MSGAARWVLPALLLLLSVGGCTAKGPIFEPLVAPPEKALVYIYRGEDLFDLDVAFTVYAGKRELAWLLPGAYVAFRTSARVLQFWAKREAMSDITLDLEPGRTYYLKVDTGVGLLARRPKLTLMEPEAGDREIRSCRKVRFL